MKLRHPLTGAIYTVLPSGLVRVEDGDRSGIFHHDGRWKSGEVTHADPHMLGWIAGPQLGRRDPLSGEMSKREGSPSQRHSAGPNINSNRTPQNDGRPGMDLGLSGRRAVVTAASKGIGLAIAQSLADEGCSVAICARGEAALEVARKDLEARGATVLAKSVDVSDGDAIKAFIAEAADSFGGLDIVVCNASGGSGMGDNAWQANFDIDVMSAARSVEAALPALSESDAGSVVFISSSAALEYLGVPQPYNAMKAALIAHASDLSQALAPRGIRVNTVSPGPIEFEGGNWEMIKQTMPKIYEGALSQCAIGRMGRPEEVARAVTFLASPAASLITGANLVTDGGFTKRVNY